MRSLWRLNAPNIACDPCLYQFSASHFRRVFTYAGLYAQRMTHRYNARGIYAYVYVPRRASPMQIRVTCRTLVRADPKNRAWLAAEGGSARAEGWRRMGG